MTFFSPLQRDHGRLRELFERFEELGSRRDRERRDVFEEIRAELEAHRVLEEDLIYPAAAAAGLGTPADVEGRRIVSRLLAELGELGVADRRFDVVFAVLRANVEQHLSREERELFPQLEIGLHPAHREALERALAARYDELRSPAPR